MYLAINYNVINWPIFLDEYFYFLSGATVMQKKLLVELQDF